ncbi:MAG: RidA family protein [Pseudomonadales bacterium]|nr:RidA family protein [Pseudomonadales bacterium]
MSEIKRLYPTGKGFSQIVIATGNRHIFISGQCAFDPSGQIVGIDDIGVQTDQVMKNIQQGLQESGASFENLVKMTVFVVDYTSEKREIIQSVRDRYIPANSGPASTLVGVSRLVAEELLIEIEVQAIADE